MTTLAQNKQNRIIQIHLTQILQKQDAFVSGVNITRVEVTKKLERARIFFSVLGSDDKQETAKKLNDLSYFFRKKLAQSLSIRKTPELYFQHDDKITRCFEINQKLSNL